MIWTVDPHIDRIKERPESAREDEFNKAFHTRNFYVFESEPSAIRFVIERAETEIRNARAAIKKAELRIKKHEQRLNPNFPTQSYSGKASSGVD